MKEEFIKRTCFGKGFSGGRTGSGCKISHRRRSSDQRVVRKKLTGVIHVPVVFKSAEESDVAGMASLRAAESQDDFFWSDRIARYMSGEHSPEHALQLRVLFVAVDEEIVGFVAGHLTQRFGCEGELQWISIAVERRGSGVARGLITRMGAWFVEQEAKRICVNVDFRNVLARRLYSSCGAQILDKNWMVWDDSRLMGHV
jgi:GNAT superfamily N-acetyltransferase